MYIRVRSRGGRTFPLTVTTSFAVTSSAGESMIRLLTVTLPLVTLFGIAARGQARVLYHLGDALAGFLFAR